MAKYEIIGGKELSGSIAVGGSKNASLPIVCATLLADKGVTVLKNVPDISDVDNLVEILNKLGAKAEFVDHTLKVDATDLKSFEPDPELVKKLRGSLLLAGPLLARFGRVRLGMPGGDSIGKRPIDTYLFALQGLGVSVTEGEVLEMETTGLVGNKIIMTEMSVMATENLIMAAVKAKGTTTVHLAATEPHVQDLCNILNKMGAKISGIGTHDLVIEGVDSLTGAEHTIIFDNEVACSFVNLAAATKSQLEITGIKPEYLHAAIVEWQQQNVNFEVRENSILVKKPVEEYKAFKIRSSIYPGLLTDYVPPFAVLATQAQGTTLVHEWMYEGRLGYIHELSKMGAKARIIDQNHAEIIGPCKLHGTNVSSLDIRSGMVMIIAALVAEGKSTLHDVEHVERGYEHIVEKLLKIGAEIARFE